MVYRYKVVDSDGKVITKSIQGESKDSIRDYLKESGYFIVSIEQEYAQLFGGLMGIMSKVAKKDVVDFTRQLSIMMNAGLTIIQSFEIFKKQTKKEALRNIFVEIDKKIRSGDTLSSALKHHSYLFSSLYIALIKSGEATGKLDEVLLKLSDNLEKEMIFTAKLKNALIYPIIVIITMFGVMFVLITFVVPQLTELYSQFDAQLPFATRVLIAISNVMVATWPIILGAILLGVYLFRSVIKTKSGRLTFDRFTMRIPLFNEVIRMGALVNSTRTLSILIGSGISILDALIIIKGTTNNMLFQNAFHNIYQQVEKGVSLGSAFEQQEIFPPILVQMIIIGENTGRLDETLGRISAYFESESELAIKALTTLIEPAILLLLGIGVGLIVFSIITPIYSLTSSFK